MGHDPDIGNTIGYSEFTKGKDTEVVRLGVSSAVDACLARMNVEGAKRLQGYEIHNKGNGTVTITLKKRGQEYAIPAEALAGIRVGATDRYKGPLANRRASRGSILITDTNVVTPQKVEDTNGDGILYQTDGPVGPTYPIQVGTIDYKNSYIDFTFVVAVTPATQAAYRHTNWTGFTAPITFNVAAGGGFRPDFSSAQTDNFVDGIKGESEIGWWGKLLSAAEAKSSVGIKVLYFGNDSEITLPLTKGEFEDVPFVPERVYITRPTQ